MSGFICGYSLNPYRWCSMRCQYCVTAMQGVSIPLMEDHSAFVGSLREELAPIPRTQVIAVGTISDAYPAIEGDDGRTRLALEVLIDEGRPFSVVTKGTAVVRDADLLRGEHRQVTMTISATDERALARIEPGAPSPAARVQAAIQLWEHGVDITVAMEPWIPDISDLSNLLELLPSELPVKVGCLNVVVPTVRARPFGAQFDQADLNRLYLDEYERVGVPDNVGWVKPIGLTVAEGGSLFDMMAMGPLYRRQWQRHWVATAPEDGEMHRAALRWVQTPR